MKFLITATFLILSQLAFAQVNNAIVFDKMIHDFGDVNEESNEVTRGHYSHMDKPDSLEQKEKDKPDGNA